MHSTSLVRLATLAVALAGGIAWSTGLPSIAQDDTAASKAFKKRGVQLQSQGQFARAIIEYRKALELNPDDASSHNNLGLAFKDMDLLDDAEAELRAAIQLKPDQKNYQFNLGIVMLRKSNLPAAEECFRKAVAIDSNDADSQYRLAQVVLMQGRTDESEQFVRQAISLKPHDPQYLHLLGDILLRQIKAENALTVYRRARQLSARPDAVLDNKIEYVNHLVTAKSSTVQSN